MGNSDSFAMDFLTGLPLLQTFKQRVDEEVQRALKENGLLSLLIIDLDHFKSVNDAFGHSRGDEVLSEFATRIQSSIRCDDQFFRYGWGRICAIVAQYRFSPGRGRQPGG